MRRWLLVVALVNAVASQTPAEANSPPPADRLVPPTAPPGVLQRDMDLVHAIHVDDLRGVERELTLPLRVQGLVFTGRACRRFATRLSIDRTDLAEFVRCLREHNFDVVPHRHGSRRNAVYGPGAPLHIRRFNDRVIAIVGLQYRGMPAGAYTIESDRFVAAFARFDREIAPSKRRRAEIDTSPDAVLDATMAVCIDGRGRVTRVETASVMADDDAWKTSVIAALRKRVATPFKSAGTPVSVCSHVRVGYPATRLASLDVEEPTVLSHVVAASAHDDGGVPGGTTPDPNAAAGEWIGPVPPPRPHKLDVPPTVLEAYRVRGDKQIAPDDATKTAIVNAGKDTVVGSFKLCVDVAGNVDDVRVLKSTAFPGYDQQLLAAIRTWAYRPYTVDGKAVPVCTAVTFLYRK